MLMNPEFMQNQPKWERFLAQSYPKGHMQEREVTIAEMRHMFDFANLRFSRGNALPKISQADILIERTECYQPSERYERTADK
jgi:hypothetical protein